VVVETISRHLFFFGVCYQGPPKGSRVEETVLVLVPADYLGNRYLLAVFHWVMQYRDSIRAVRLFE
jgi:hypothetical protein